MNKHINEDLINNVLKQEALKLLNDPKLVPKERTILETIVNNQRKNLNNIDAWYDLKMSLPNITHVDYSDWLPSCLTCNLVIFPWRWVGKSHKTRQDISPRNLIAKKVMFQTYKHDLHKRKYSQLKKK